MWLSLGAVLPVKSCPPPVKTGKTLLWSSGVAVAVYLHKELTVPKAGCPRSKPADSVSGKDPLFPRWLLATVLTAQQAHTISFERRSSIIKPTRRQLPPASCLGASPA